MSTTPPSSTKGAPRLAIFSRASSDVRANISPRSISSRLHASKSASSAGKTKRTKSSQSDAIEIGASGRCLSASPAARSSSRSPIIVVAELRAMSSVSAWIAAAHTDAEPSSRSSRSYATRRADAKGRARSWWAGLAAMYWSIGSTSSIFARRDVVEVLAAEISARAASTRRVCAGWLTARRALRSVGARDAQPGGGYGNLARAARRRRQRVPERLYGAAERRADQPHKGKVGQLKELSIAIGSHVKEDNRLLGDLDNSFDSAGSLLSGTMKRLGSLADSGGNRHMLYLALFVIFVLLLVYKLFR